MLLINERNMLSMPGNFAEAKHQIKRNSLLFSTEEFHMPKALSRFHL